MVTDHGWSGSMPVARDTKTLVGQFFSNLLLLTQSKFWWSSKNWKLGQNWQCVALKPMLAGISKLAIVKFQRNFLRIFRRLQGVLLGKNEQMFKKIVITNSDCFFIFYHLDFLRKSIFAFLSVANGSKKSLGVVFLRISVFLNVSHSSSKFKPKTLELHISRLPIAIIDSHLSNFN